MVNGHVTGFTTPARSPLRSLGSTRLDATMGFVLSGELDLSNAPEVEQVLARWLQNVVRTKGAPARLTLDLRNLTFIDSAGIEALVSTRRRCDRYGTELLLRLGTSPVARLLSVAGVSGYLNLE